MSDIAPGPDALEVDVVVPASLAGQRVDRALAMLTGITRRRATEAVAAGAVQVDGAVVATRSTALRSGQRLQAVLEPEEADRPHPDGSVVFGVVYEDDDLVVVDKPAGLVVHHGAGQQSATLVDGLVARYPDLMSLSADPSDLGHDGDDGGDVAARPGIVHRLDKGTSGLVVVARSAAALSSLRRQMRDHTAERRYLALVVGTVSGEGGTIDAPIGRSARRPDRMAVRGGGRVARTHYSVRQRFNAPAAATLVEASLETGRTHQVRVHFTAIGHPVLGDDRYGADRSRPPALMAALERGRVFLHAWQLTVDHPDGRRLTWESPLPGDLQRTLELLS